MNSIRMLRVHVKCETKPERKETKKKIETNRIETNQIEMEQKGMEQNEMKQIEIKLNKWNVKVFLYLNDCSVPKTYDEAQHGPFLVPDFDDLIFAFSWLHRVLLLPFP